MCFCVCRVIMLRFSLVGAQDRSRSGSGLRRCGSGPDAAPWTACPTHEGFGLQKWRAWAAVFGRLNSETRPFGAIPAGSLDSLLIMVSKVYPDFFFTCQGVLCKENKKSAIACTHTDRQTTEEQKEQVPIPFSGIHQELSPMRGSNPQP
jgi:hypothetical protein